MIVKELKELLSKYSDYLEVMIDNNSYLFDVSRTTYRVNLDKNNNVINEENVDNSFNEKESVLILSTY